MDRTYHGDLPDLNEAQMQMWQTVRALSNEERRDNETAIALYQKLNRKQLTILAEHDDVLAMVRLSDTYNLGEKEGLKWARRAFEADHRPDAIVLLINHTASQNLPEDEGHSDFEIQQLYDYAESGFSWLLSHPKAPAYYRNYGLLAVSAAHRLSKEPRTVPTQYSEVQAHWKAVDSRRKKAFERRYVLKMSTFLQAVFGALVLILSLYFLPKAYVNGTSTQLTSLADLFPIGFIYVGGFFAYFVAYSFFGKKENFSRFIIPCLYILCGLVILIVHLASPGFHVSVFAYATLAIVGLLILILSLRQILGAIYEKLKRPSAIKSAAADTASDLDFLEQWYRERVDYIDRFLRRLDDDPNDTPQEREKKRKNREGTVIVEISNYAEMCRRYLSDIQLIRKRLQ